jgi:uncharacterized repeat protein (TIGR03803 family)
LTAHLTTLFSFNGSNGQSPGAGLIEDAYGDLFGTTAEGACNNGTVFELKNIGTVAAPVYAGSPTTLVSFDVSDGTNPQAELIADANGDLLGTTLYAGATYGGGYGHGTVFELKNTGTVVAPVYVSSPTILVTFNGSSGEAGPYAGLTADANGDLFGTTSGEAYGGVVYGYGTVFEIKNTGTVAAPVYASSPTTLVNFDGSDGKNPYAGLIKDANGDLFGTSSAGGAYGYGTVFELDNTGSVAAPVYASSSTTPTAQVHTPGLPPTRTATFSAPVPPEGHMAMARCSRSPAQPS